MSTEREVALQKYREKRDAFVAVFGADGKRTIHQERVLKDLETLCQFHDSAIVKDGAGRYDGGLTAYKAGLQDVMKRIYLRIRWREDDEQHSSRDPDPDEPGSPASGSN